ncbi:sensor histidine kinase [Burkholderia pyrrocinia]|uniref:sensor histidine kinase n=1 Tax=Burkholderia pyrrocinia TaxID=60550 RepID=UPI002AAF79B4|nr:ATP-binding protein [Burkholderia pyrrocinia]
MLKYWIRSLSAQLWVMSVATLAISLSILAVVVIQAFNHFPDETLGGHEEMEIAQTVMRGLVLDSEGRPVSVRPSGATIWILEALPDDYQYRVLDGGGNVLLAPMHAKEGPAWIAGDLARAEGKARSVTIGGHPFHVLTIRVPEHQVPLYVQVAVSPRLIDVLISTRVKPIPSVIRVLLAVSTVVFGLTLTLTLHFLLKPLREVSRAAAQITPRNLATRLSSKGVPSEIRPLIQAFNEALGRLEHGFAVQQQFLASAAHELQTPLTLMRGQIELQPEIEDKDALLREIDLMARQVRQLLHLAEVSELQNFNFSEVDSVAVAQDVIDYLTRKADRNQIKLVLEVPVAPASIWADRGALFILLKNIVENAVNVSPSNGFVRLVVDDTSIRVIDEGPGIKPEYTPFLFKRYWRAPDAKHLGAGLGLAICKEIATAHEWDLVVSRLIPGTQFRVVFSGHYDVPLKRSPLGVPTT